MNSAPSLLKISIAFSLSCTALALLIFSLKYSPAHAQVSTASQAMATPVGILQHDLQRDGKPGYLIHVIGYAPGQQGSAIKVLAKEWVAR